MGSGARATARPSPKLKGLTPPQLLFRDVSEAWGITAPNFYGGDRTKKFILEMTGNGAALLDYDNDGKLDIVLLNGARLDGASRPSVVYRNLGDGKFKDQTTASGLSTGGWVQGACAGDIDNDGFTDLLVTRYGALGIWKNERGRFRDASPLSGLPQIGEDFFTGCTMTDYDRDGRLDLFVTTYVAFSLKRATVGDPIRKST